MQLTFDLDPGEAVAWASVIEAAWLVKEELTKLKLKSFVKTTGGKGLHVVIPITRRYTWDQIEIYTKTFAAYLSALQPNRFTTNMKKAKRHGKIFIDYLRNQRGATAIAAYSPRARKNAPVATPLNWDELSVEIRSNTFTTHNLPKRLAGLKNDPWADFFELKQTLQLP
jgi:bifunctional non-homologous end joining protein LigD